MKIKKKYYFILLFYSLAQSQSIEDSRQNAITNAIKNASPGVASINVTQIKRYMNPFSFYDQFWCQGIFCMNFDFKNSCKNKF